MKNHGVAYISIVFSALVLTSIFTVPVVAQENIPSNNTNGAKTSLSEKQEKIYLNLAESLYNDGEYVRALSIYLDFLDLYPDSTYCVRALETLADLYEKQQQYSEALSVYESLYQRTGPSGNRGIHYYYNQARILNTMGDVEKASQIYADIIKISPDSSYAKKSQMNHKLNTLFE